MQPHSGVLCSTSGGRAGSRGFRFSKAGFRAGGAGVVEVQEIFQKAAVSFVTPGVEGVGVGEGLAGAGVGPDF